MQIVCQKHKFVPLQRLCNAQKKAKYLSLRTGRAGQEEEEEEEEKRREEKRREEKRREERRGEERRGKKQTE